MLIQRKAGRHNADYKLADMYKVYAETSKNPVDYKLYKKLCLAINEQVATKIVTEPFMFIIPYRMGNISVRKYKIKYKERTLPNGQVLPNFPVDWKETKKLWEEEPELKGKKVVYYLNEHSNGYRFKIVWNPITSKIKHKDLLAFAPLRKMSRRLAQTVINDASFDAYEYIK